jgi:HD-GYP domain-containing protein (c-di-GMP phosphodiesterase class II)
VETENLLQQRHMVTSYIENFLARPHTGRDAASELVSSLKKLGAAVSGRNNSDGQRAAVRTLTRAAETREVSAGHGDAVAKYAETIGHELLLPEEEMADLVFAARVHDVGKIVIPEKVLNKARPLTADEYNLIKQHAEVGAQIVETVPDSERLCEIIRHHHEHFDGSGYPDGLKGEQIPLGARIIAVAEAYHEMISDRPYAAGRSPADAIAELESLSGTQFDGMLVRILIHQLKIEKGTRAGN